MSLRGTVGSCNAAASYFRRTSARISRPSPPTADPIVRGEHREDLCLLGLLTDTLTALSDVFHEPYLSTTNPRTENPSLLAALDFVLQHARKIATGPTNSLFDTFWRTLVANKVITGDFTLATSISGITYADIFGLLLDLSTGRSPTLPGQTYSARQKLPRKQKDRLDLASLDRNPKWEDLEAARIALASAMRYRRLGVTEAGRLGLFPRHAEVGDAVCVVRMCNIPLLLRWAAGEQSGKYTLVGECYVHGIMDGEAVEEAKARRGQVDDEDGWPGEIITLI